MTLCDDCQKLCKQLPGSTHTMTSCSEFELKITAGEVDFMIRRLFKFYHIPETDEQVKIMQQTLEKQANIVQVRDKILTFLDKFKAKLS